jgi:hypothetical protein
VDNPWISLIHDFEQLAWIDAGARRVFFVRAAMSLFLSPFFVFGSLRARIAAPIFSLVLVGCLPTDAPGSSSSSGSTGSSGATATDGGDGGKVSAAEQACLDFATVYAGAAMRCGGDADAERKAFIKDVAGGDCADVTIRNETELRGMCFPSFTVIDCASLTNARFDPSCAEQIQRSK